MGKKIIIKIKYKKKETQNFVILFICLFMGNCCNVHDQKFILVCASSLDHKLFVVSLLCVQHCVRLQSSTNCTATAHTHKTRLRRRKVDSTSEYKMRENFTAMSQDKKCLWLQFWIHAVYLSNSSWLSIAVSRVPLYSFNRSHYHTDASTDQNSHIKFYENED